MTYSEYRDREVSWELNRREGVTFSAEFPYRAVVDGVVLEIKIGDFPAESAYTLFADGEPVDEFDSFPDNWTRPPGW
ncbi:hypothetical protein NDR87_13015 [Nocardia sp. CDC159]|uniref:Uncharacterized protein n=1 Tax=Nocardia pulmonis TaxID=2951408 RepID=A0A9X2IZ74_9NOCA|nr:MULTISPECIES: hypothetical protein [Nocardia]MCM6774656.1 hypothetical protein [Nocardia pulmonis]MCM6787279.1 hypothetical protein [Nocardia sp. CDC159]